MRTPHSLAERLADLDEAVAIADDLGARELSIDARNERAWTRVLVGRFDEAHCDIHRIARLADELGQKSERRVVDAWELSFAYVRENIDEVEARDLQGLLGRKTAYTGQAYGVRLLMARYHQDRAEETIPILENFARMFPLSGSWHCALASTYATVGRHADAERQLESIASAGYAAVPRTHDWLTAFTFLANAAQILSNVPRARELRDILLPFERHVVVLGVGNFIGGLVSNTLGDLHRVLGDVAEAERCYSIALDIAERMRSPMTRAWIAVSQAELYLRPEARDPARASALLAVALPIVKQVGAGLLLRRIRALATELQGPLAAEALVTRH
jgi:tetratricopeptide (TPR) repeat protein